MRSITIILITFLCSVAFSQNVVKKTRPKFKEFQSVRLEVNAGSSTITATNKVTGAKRTLEASKNITFDIKILHHWSPSSRSYLGVDYNDLAFKTNTGRINSGNLLSAKVGHIINPFTRLSLSGELLLYSHVLSTPSLDLTGVTTGAGQISYQFDLYHAPKTRFGFGQSLLFAPSAFEYKAGIYGRKVYQRFSVELALGYEGGTWEDNKSHTSFNNYIIGTKFSIPFF